MPTILGTGAHRYQVVDSWAKLPPGQEFNADVAAVGVDKQDRVYAFNRGQHPMVVLDRDITSPEAGPLGAARVIATFVEGEAVYDALPA